MRDHEIIMLDMTFAVAGKTVHYRGALFTIEAAGVKAGIPYVTTTPFDEDVSEVMVRHLRLSLPRPFSLDEIQRELDEGDVAC